MLRAAAEKSRRHATITSMANMRYLIVGGGIAGTSAAEAIRQRDPRGHIAIVSDEAHPLYARLTLSKPGLYTGSIAFSSLRIHPPDWYEAQHVSLLSGQEAIALSLSDHRVTLKDGTVLEFDRLLLALGARAAPWGVKGSGRRGVFMLRTIDDAQAIIEGLRHIRRAVVVGGGFLGFELCSIVRQAGKHVTLLIRKGRYWERLLDEASSTIIEQALERGGVRIISNAHIQEVMGQGHGIAEGVLLQNGEEVLADAVFVGVGATYPIDWVRQAGIATQRGILTNELLETSAPGVFAAGDIAEVLHPALGERVQFGNWTSAQLQGMCAGANMAGERQVFTRVPPYTVLGFGVAVAFVGRTLGGNRYSVVMRNDARKHSDARFVFLGKKLVGATLMNRMEDLNVTMKILESGEEVSPEYFADPKNNLRELLN